MSKTIECVRFAGNWKDLYSRERAVVLHRNAQIVAPDGYVAFVVSDGKLSKPIVGTSAVFGESGAAFVPDKGSSDDFIALAGGTVFIADEKTAVVDIVFVSCTARARKYWEVKVECEDGVTVEAGGTVDYCVSDCQALAEAVIASPEDDVEARLDKRINYEIGQALKADRSREGMLPRLKSVVCAVAVREFGLLPARFDMSEPKVRGGKEIDDEPIAKFCSRCGASLMPYVRYCPNCGNKIS